MTGYAAIKDALLNEGVGPEWWKEGFDADGTPHIGLDIRVQRGLQLIEKMIHGYSTLDELEVQARLFNYGRRSSMGNLVSS